MEFRGKKYREVTVTDLVPNVPLRTALFLYLPINGRMLKIRNGGQAVEPEVLASIQQKGPVQLFILDPAAHPESYELTGREAPLNPRLGAELAEKVRAVAPVAGEEAASRVKNASSVAEAGDTRVGADVSADDGTILRAEKNEEFSESFGTEPRARENAETFGAAGDPDDETEREFDGEGKTPEVRRSFGPDAASAEESRGFSGDATEGDASRTIGKGEAPGDAGPETIFARDGDEEAAIREIQGTRAFREEAAAAHGQDETRTFAADAFAGAAVASEEVRAFSAAEEEMRPVSTWTDHTHEEPTSVIARGVTELEEKLAHLSPENKAFVESLQKPRRATDPAQTAGAALHEHLGRLRGELDDAVTAPVAGLAEKAELLERRKDLGEKIARFEATTAILDYLEDDGVTELPGDLARKPKAELIAHLEKNLAGLAGSAVLSPAEREAVARTIDQAKSRDPELSGQRVRDLGAQAVEASRSAADAEALGKVRGSLAAQVNAARAAVDLANALAEKRHELIRSLGDPEAGKLIREEVLELERLTRRIDGGEAVSGTELAPFLSKTPASPDDDVQILIAELNQLGDAVTNGKRRAALAEAELRARVLGNVAQPEEKEYRFLRGPELPPATAVNLQALNEARDSLLRQQMQLRAGGSLTTSEARDLEVAVMREVRQAQAVLRVEARLAETQAELGSLLRTRAEDPAGAEERETEAILLQKDVDELRALRDELRAGKNPEGLRRFMSENGGAPTAPGDIQQLLKAVAEVSKDAAATAVKAAEAESLLARDIGASGSAAVKSGAVTARSLTEVAKRASRELEEYLRTGREPGPNEIWELNGAIAAGVKGARTEANVARRISELAREHAELLSVEPGSPEERARYRLEAERLRNDMRKLEAVALALERGDAVDEKTIAPFRAPAEEVFLFAADQGLEENARRIKGAFDALKTELVRERVRAMEALAGTEMRDPGEAAPAAVGQAGAPAEFRLPPSTEAEQDFTRTISDTKEQREMQAGVFAAALFRSFGYRAEPLERDLLLACLLSRYTGDEIQGAFSDQVVNLHRAGQVGAPKKDMLLRDAAQAMRLARAYVDSPRVVTGSFALHPDFLVEAKEKLPRDELDPELFERARQTITYGIANAERDELIAQARHVAQRLAQWKQKSA